MIFTVWLFLLPSSPIVLVLVVVLGLLVQPGVPRKNEETHANDFDPIWRAGTRIRSEALHRM
jgi:hypothetical protein